jgi:hypothetical protein
MSMWLILKRLWEKISKEVTSKLTLVRLAASELTGF